MVNEPEDMAAKEAAMPPAVLTFQRFARNATRLSAWTDRPIICVRQHGSLTRGNVGQDRQRVIVLGSTGSIGRSALDVLWRLRDRFEVVGLAAGSRAAELAEQARQFHPRAVAMGNGANAVDLRGSPGNQTQVFQGEDALDDLVRSVDCDCVVCGVVGICGLRATMRAVELGRRVALANKEALVVAGSLIMPLAKRSGATIIPIDSEHSAVFQALQAGRIDEVRRIFLTASGGPFRTWSAEEMERITVEEALRHPTWDMGPKITIDSATMMNKAMEVVEAKWLFGLAAEQIEVVVHPESIIHSMVEFRDGSTLAQLGAPDMRTPIQFALTFPERLPCPSEPLDPAKFRQLNFQAPDAERFPASKLGHEVLRRGGTCGAVLNGANEAAVQMFRDGAIAFLDIARLTERALVEHRFIASPTLDELIEADRWARQEVARCIPSQVRS